MGARTLFVRVAAGIGLAAAGVAGAAEVKAVFALGLKAAMEDLGPRFERASGHALKMTFEPPGPAAKRMREGEVFDVVALPREPMEGLQKEGLLAAGGSEIARSRMGIAVRRGAPKPDIATPEALKAALLAARSVVHSDPARGGAGGTNSVRMFTRLGIAEEMKAKTVYPRHHSPAGVAQEVADGRAELALNQIHELAAQPGLEVLGPFPGDLQQSVVFIAALSSASTQPGVARALIDYLRSPEALGALKAHGLEPGARE